MPYIELQLALDTYYSYLAPTDLFSSVLALSWSGGGLLTALPFARRFLAWMDFTAVREKRR